MTKEEMCIKCQEKFKASFDKNICKTCVGVAFVDCIDSAIELLSDIRNNADYIAKCICRGKEEIDFNDLVRKSN